MKISLTVKYFWIAGLWIAIGLFVSLGCDSTPSPGPGVTPPESTPNEPANSSETSASPATADLADEQVASGEFDWLQYRGPNGQSVHDSDHLPTQWSDNEGIIWKSELPGRGSSSPIVVGDRVFVTAYSGYGMSPTDRGKVGFLRYHLICKDRRTGQTIWQRNIKGSMLTQYLNDTVLGHGFASNTPVSDGEMVYLFCGCTGVFAFDLDGNLAWEQNVGTQFYFFGSSASPVVYNDLLIVNASVENKTIYAFDKKTGQGVWKIDDIDRCYSLPVFGQAPDGSTEMVVVEEDLVHGYDPETGQELWSCEGIHNYIIAVPIIQDGICYCNGGLERQMMAIKLGGRGDVTESHKVWEVPFGGNVGSPVLYNDVLFVADDNGIMGSYDSKTGQRLKRQRTGTKDPRIYASPLLVGDRIYLPLQDEGVLIVEANPEMEIIQRNKFEEDESPIHGSIAPNGDRMFIRTDKFLYCIGSATGAPKLVKYDNQLMQRKPIEPIARVDFDPNTNRLKPYCYYLAKDEAAVMNILLSPYKSVITEEQTAKSKELIQADYAKFDELRKAHDEAYWSFMKGEIDRETLIEQLKPIETETLAHSGKVRIPVKKLFSKEQMDQHLKEAAEWQRKQKEKQQQNNK